MYISLLCRTLTKMMMKKGLIAPHLDPPTTLCLSSWWANTRPESDYKIRNTWLGGEYLPLFKMHTHTHIHSIYSPISDCCSDYLSLNNSFYFFSLCTAELVTTWTGVSEFLTWAAHSRWVCCVHVCRSFTVHIFGVCAHGRWPWSRVSTLFT